MPPVAIYSFLFLIPSLFAGGAVSATTYSIETRLSDEAVANASTVITPTALRSLISYSDFTRISPNAGSYYVSLGLNVYVYTTVIYFSLRIWLRLRSSMALLAADTRNREVNRQLNRVLAAQALVPLVCTRLPSVCVQLIGVTGTATIGFGTQASLSIFFVVQPVAYGLLTLLLIRPYRREVSRLVCRWGRETESQAVNVQQTVNSSSTALNRHSTSQF